jgi:hypothetical protein
MRTGLLDEPSEITQEQSLDLVKKLMALTLSLVTRSGESAAIYATHAGRPTAVLSDDVNRGLMYQSKIFMSQVTDEEVIESYGTVNEALDADETDTDEDDEDDDSEEEEEAVAVQEEEEQGWTRSDCSCVICKGMNDAADTWDTYEPEDEVLRYLKSRTDEIIAKKL